MTEHGPADRPGHLDIDAVSAFVDRDLPPDDLATIEFHLGECPPCRREFLEIHATVLLLAGLPQYAPRRSFVPAQAPVLLKPADVRELPQRRIDDGDARHREAREVEVRVDGKRALARFPQRAGERVAFV